jgi:multiple antibiotic resistance protein
MACSIKTIGKWIRRPPILPFLALGALCLFAVDSAAAQEITSGQLPIKSFPIAHIATFLFLMLGPSKIIGPFLALTKGATIELRRQIATRAIVFSVIATGLAASLGEYFLSEYGIPVPVLAFSAGIVLFLVAVLDILAKFTQTTAEIGATAGHAPDARVALSPLAFPTIVTPHGVAALVVFMVLSEDWRDQLTIGAIALAIMALNWIVMVIAHRIGPALMIFLSLLGAVLSIIQVALGLQIMSNSLRALGVL